jgi:hypothetical protein
MGSNKMVSPKKSLKFFSQKRYVEGGAKNNSSSSIDETVHRAEATNNGFTGEVERCQIGP